MQFEEFFMIYYNKSAVICRELYSFLSIFYLIRYLKQSLLSKEGIILSIYNWGNGEMRDLEIEWLAPKFKKPVGSRHIARIQLISDIQAYWKISIHYIST